MGMAAILLMWQTFIPPSQGVSGGSKKMFENVEQQTSVIGILLAHF